RRKVGYPRIAEGARTRRCGLPGDRPGRAARGPRPGARVPFLVAVLRDVRTSHGAVPTAPAAHHRDEVDTGRRQQDLDDQGEPEGTGEARHDRGPEQGGDDADDEHQPDGHVLLAGDDETSQGTDDQADEEGTDDGAEESTADLHAYLPSSLDIPHLPGSVGKMRADVGGGARRPVGPGASGRYRNKG